MYDILILGGGPAGLSAAVAAQGRGKRCLVLSNPGAQNPLSRAPAIHNYLGLPGLSGGELMERFLHHALDMGTELRTGRALSAMALDGAFYLTVGSEVCEGRKLILAGGVQRGQKYPGEEALLGRGVSYCATCDGMFYRRKSVIVIGRAKDAPLEANYLREIGCQVTYLSPTQPVGLREDIPYLRAGRISVLGGSAVTGVEVEGAVLPCDGVFILRESVAPADLLPGLAVEDGYIAVNRRMETNLPGVYAAGDCTGKPLQIAKAVGEGLIAGEAAAEALGAEHA
ncbi:MAG: NAD(P)/FAD-dependent oxidoreductase [Clostridiales bacterium]|nr:NAD(P)/FAD-dependent oxidoreductase [Clostridiales bacterium]